MRHLEKYKLRRWILFTSLLSLMLFTVFIPMPSQSHPTTLAASLLAPTSTAVASATPDVPSVNIPITIGAQDSGSSITFASNTPITALIEGALVTIILAAGGVGARQAIGFYFLVRTSQVKREDAQHQNVLAGEQQKRELEIEDERANRKLQLENSSHVKSLIETIGPLVVELNRTNGVTERAFATFESGRKEAELDRQETLTRLSAQWESHQRSVLAQNELTGALKDTVGTLVEAIAAASRITNERQTDLIEATSQIKSLLTEGETSTVKVIGGKMNGIDGRIANLEIKVQAMIILLQKIAENLGVDTGLTQPLLPTEPKEDSHSQEHPNLPTAD